MSVGHKVFSEQEVGEIVRRAAELQEQGAGSYRPGITREELARIAREVGVDERFLEQAIRESLGPPSKKGLFTLTEEFERVVDGELRREDFDVLLDHLKPGFGNSSSITQVGRTVSGHAKSGPISSANVKVTSRNGRTRVTVRSSPVLAYLIGMHPALIGSIICGAAFGEKGLAIAAIGGAAALLAAGGVAFKQLVKLGNRKARELADQLEERIYEETHCGQREPAPQTQMTPEDVELRQQT